MLDYISGIAQSKPGFEISTGGSAVADTGEISSPGVPLGNTTTLQSVFDFELIKRRVSRYLLQAVIGDILPGERLSSCLRLIVPGKDFVSVLYSGQVKRAHYGNLCVCGSVWGCPVCSAKITERRRVEVEPAIKNWPGSLVMGAFTLQHSPKEKLIDVKNLLYEAYAKIYMGWCFQEIKKRFGLVGVIGSSEVTWGSANGWHPHKHALLFLQDKITQGEMKTFESTISELFRKQLKNLGGYGSPQYSVKFSLGNGLEEKNYVYKWGLDYELTKSPVKKGRGDNYSPFELAQWAMNGELKPVQLFREYYWAYKGSHQLSYSKGLRDILKLNEEKTDLELAKETEQDAVLMARICREAWSMICKNNLRGQLLEVASIGDPELLQSYIDSLLVSWGSPRGVEA